jgi:hypothetical protein
MPFDRRYGSGTMRRAGSFIICCLLGSLLFAFHDTSVKQGYLGSCRIFPSNNIWNTPVDTLPIDANSSAYIATIGPASNVHPDFGSGLWNGGPIGIPYTTVPDSQTKVAVDFLYAGESDPGPYPIPADVPIEGGSDGDGDRHALIVDRDNCILYELYRVFPPAAGGWTADSGAIYPLGSNALRPATWTSADAAGLPMLPGLVRYDEVEAGEIKHAIRFTVPQTRRAFIWPARHFASSLTGIQYPPMGQRFRLKAGYDISGFSPQVRIILLALKKYGMILADNGAAWYISGAPDERWDNDVLHELHDVIGTDFEAVDESSLMVNPDSGEAKQRKDDLLGTWAGQGVYSRNSDTAGWVPLATPASKITAGDLDGDGIDDLIGIWPSQGGVWVKYSASGAWANLASTADWIAAADMNRDGRAELLGTWTGQGVFWRNNTTGVWTQLATPATKVTAGDLDGDGIADLIGIWPSQGGVWVKYSRSGAWAFLSSTADWIATGDMNGDDREDLLGAWTGQGVYYRDSMTGQWVLMATPATMIAAGDLDADRTDDLIGIWPSQGGVWVKYSLSEAWANLSSSADWIASGKLRSATGQGAGAAQSLARGLIADRELESPMGGPAIGPLRTAGSVYLSANSPGRDGFTPIIEKNLKPEEKKTTTRFESRIPGPGEPGFRCAQQKNIFPLK